MTPIAILSIAVSVAAPLPKERPGTSSVVGEWVIEKLRVGGADLEVDHSLRFVFGRDGTYGVYRGEYFLDVWYKYESDLKVKPATIDWNGPWDKATARGIFVVDGDTLKVCCADPDKPRPLTFESTPSKPTKVFVFTRVKKQ